MSNGERLMVYNIVRTGFLWSATVFEKEVGFHELDFENSDFEFEVSKSTIYTHTVWTINLNHSETELLSSNINKKRLSQEVVCFQTVDFET